MFIINKNTQDTSEEIDSFASLPKAKKAIDKLILKGIFDDPTIISISLCESYKGILVLKKIYYSNLKLPIK
jgi:hypothetical protein